jgi:glycosyltransferase involved in cell wall biosynthesis
VRFSIVTASYRQLDWLKCCALSVADQGVDVEHIIQDGGTGPELEAWVRINTNAHLVMEPDHGMYDALNRGFARTKGEILAWLNCDEQYLPGALKAAEERFAAEPDLDVLLADNLIVDPERKYLAHRFSLVPTLGQMWVRFPVASCALFFRRRVWQPFDTQWKSVGDWWWFRAMVERGARMGILRKFVAAFTETSGNLGLAAVTVPEHAKIIASRPWWARGIFKHWLLAQHRWRMWRSGAFAVPPFQYEIHTRDSIDWIDHAGTARRRPGLKSGSPDPQTHPRRREFIVSHPTARWVRRR